MSVTSIENEVLSLSAKDRARLIDVIWESLSEPKMKARDAADILAELKKSLGK